MSHETHDALPERACVWMEAGVINYWLCDRAFDCENCPLDQALRGGFKGRPPVGFKRPSDGSGREGAPLPADIRFHPSHLWLAPVSNEEWALGLDHHALGAFSDPPMLSLPRPGRRLKHNDELLALLVDSDALRWPAPVDAIVLERNNQWNSAPESIRNASYPRSWALLLKLCTPPDKSWLSPAAMEERNREERVALRDFIMSHQDGTGQSPLTAADGGLPIATPDRLCPLPEYLTFLRTRWRLLPNSA